MRGRAAAAVTGAMTVEATPSGAGTMKEVPPRGKLGFKVFPFSLFPNFLPVHSSWQKPTGSQLERVFGRCSLQTLSCNSLEHSIYEIVELTHC